MNNNIKANDLTGANWRIWDLHVHTPASIVQYYGAETDETWEKYLSDLEALPEHFKVLGINDYIFIDGYRRILAERQKGRLSNIDLILPVIELRLDKFGGTDSSLSRVNFHVIFSEEIEPDVIEQQFIQALSRSYKLSPDFSSLESEWKGVATHSAIEDLGKKIIETIPEIESRNFCSPIVEGFNALNFQLENVLDVLKSSYFRDKHLTAVGKTEWWNIKWNDKSIADKKTIINSADLVFIASNNITDFSKAKQGLVCANVNSRLLDCSDAHAYSDSAQKDRIGNCCTWIKADPSLRGLRLAAIEPEERIFIGETPPQVVSIKQNKTKYINSISIKRIMTDRTSFQEQWFDTSLPLNSGLVAIIGNKGSGKSALTDIIGLLGNAQSKANFSFLNKEKFCKLPENKARLFNGLISWKDGTSESLRLDSDISSQKVEKVRYVPQDYFEVICTQIPSSLESQFDKELEAVIFSHISDTNKLGKSNLAELLKHKLNEIADSLSRTIIKIENINKKIVFIESHLMPEYASTLQNKLNEKESELASLEIEKPPKIVKPASMKNQTSPLLKRLQSQKSSIDHDKMIAEERFAEITESLDTVQSIRDKIGSFRDEHASFVEDLQDLLHTFKLSHNDLIELKIHERPIIDIEEQLKKEKKRIEKKLSKRNPLGYDMKLENIEAQLGSLREQMDAPSREFEETKRKIQEWNDKKKELSGNKRKVGSHTNLLYQIAELKTIPAKLTTLYSKRIKLSKQALNCLQRQKLVYQELYSPVQDFVEEHPDIGVRIQLKFDVSIVESGFVETFIDMINLSKPGAFTGSVEGKRAVKEILERHDMNTVDGALSFVEEIVDNLKGNERISLSIKKIAEQLKKGKSLDEFYTYLYSFKYLIPKFVLRLGSKDLNQLSPGERGALLVIFYLLIDKDTKPLIIDQPENNLDNETVATLLVPAIKKAKKKRQIVIVTHNPIIAVVCNADQVVVAMMNKAVGNKIEYISGAIENPVINKHIVDILEGTLSAFDNRNLKYIRNVLFKAKESKK